MIYSPVEQRIFRDSLIKEHFREVTEKANLKKLNDLIRQNPEVYKNLTLPAEKLPIEYLYLLAENFNEELEGKTLLDVIKRTLKTPKCFSFFSLSKEKITGFFSYKINNFKEVENIKIFSFDINQPNVVLIRDLYSLLKKLQLEYRYISWYAIKKNPANKIYQQAIERFQGIHHEFLNSSDQTWYIKYTIPGTESLF